jgi:hypothetical protein
MIQIAETTIVIINSLFGISESVRSVRNGKKRCKTDNSCFEQSLTSVIWSIE